MEKRSKKPGKPFGARSRTIDLSSHFNWPRRVPGDQFWRNLAERVRGYPTGEQNSWGIPFLMAQGGGPRVILVCANKREVAIPIRSAASYVCFLHSWEQLPGTVRRKDPTEGLAVGEYQLDYADGSRHVQHVRARFEVAMAESPGPPWLALPFEMPGTIDPTKPAGEHLWGWLQCGIAPSARGPAPLLYAMENPHPHKRIQSLTIRGLQESPLLVAGITLYRGAGHPLRHLPRRTYRIKTPAGPPKVEQAQVDLGVVNRIERTSSPRGKRWLDSKVAGTRAPDPDRGGEDLLEVTAAEDATLSVKLQGRKNRVSFSIGEAFHRGKSVSGKSSLEVLGKQRQWVHVKVIDGSTGKPTPVRIHFSGARGEYLAPYGHHSQVNANWFEDYGADLVWGGRSYAYVPGEFTTDMPAGDVYVEIFKGFEYEPLRRKVTIRPGQKELKLQINRWNDLRSRGWVTADTHVHFLSPQTAWLEAQAEGLNVVNLLASQWGRLFTNVGDLKGRVGVVEDDTIVYVGTENRNHMLGHMSMLGTKGLPVFPMCCGGVGESWIGDPDFLALAEWARENKRKGGVVIRPHFPYCGCTEDPVPIIKGLVDALEIRELRGDDFPTQEWYRYLNCGYRVAVAAGTDKMSAATAIGWMRTYAKLDPDRPFNYDNWARAVRAGRTVATIGPTMDLTVEGQQIGGTIRMPAGGGTLSVEATAESIWPLGSIEVVYNGRVVARAKSSKGARRLRIKDKLTVRGSGWIAARCCVVSGHPANTGGSWAAAHTSPVYIKCGDTRAFDGPAAEHMLALVEGSIEYINTLATVFDERARKRMVKLFKEARDELKGRLATEAGHTHHHGRGPYHTHGHGRAADHKH